jgi:hypothetical protein
MNYKKLIIDGYNGKGTMPYISYFKQQAQIARDNYVEFADFFNACNTVLDEYKQADFRNFSIDENGNILGLGTSVWDHSRTYRLNRHELERIEAGLLEAKQYLQNPKPQPEAAEQLESNANKVNTGKPQKNFVDYLHHDNKDALMEKLHELLDGKNSGKYVAQVLEALENKNYLIKDEYKTPIVITEFDLNCRKQSITKYLNKGDKNTPYHTNNELQQIIDTLP